MNTAIDHEARMTARDAMQAIGAHEKLCEQRALEAMEFRGRIKDSIDRVNKTLVTLMIGAVGSLAIMLANLVLDKVFK